jgi:two-component sensor histidine kinase
MPGYNVLLLATLIVFTFGALSFAVLAVTYWRQRRPRAGRAFAAFTLLCAAAFAINLILRVVGDSPAAAALMLLRQVATGLLPPVLLHVVWRQGRPDASLRRLVAPFYVIACAGAMAHGLADAEVLTGPSTDWLELEPAMALGAAAVLGLATQISAASAGVRIQRDHRRWNIMVLGLMAAASAAAAAWSSTLFDLVPDYFLLMFFCITLYYRERLVFFDLLIKRGAYFGVGLVVLTAFFAACPQRAWRQSPDGSWAWILALLLTPLWLMGPWIDRRLGGFIDRRWLGRRYPAAEGERRFVQDVQAASSESDLAGRATDSLAAVFQTEARVRFVNDPAPAVPEDGLSAELQHRGEPLGWVSLEPRPDLIPFLSDDRRLLHSLARTLSVVLENVRFRDQRAAQEEQERQLRLLASRAELKALRARINPHFLFNALNAIAGLIQDQPQLADETIEQLAQVFRYTLRKAENEWVRLEEEIEFVTAYLRVEQARFGERLQVSLEIGPGAGAISVPAMTVQPLVENAIKHGAAAVGGRATVMVRAAIHDQVLAIEVSDNGPGFPEGFSLEESDPGHGLRNIADRLKGYYGDAGRLLWENSDDGARVRLEIPVRPPSDITERNVHAARAHS